MNFVTSLFRSDDDPGEHILFLEVRVGDSDAAENTLSGSRLH